MRTLSSHPFGAPRLRALCFLRFAFVARACATIGMVMRRRDREGRHIENVLGTVTPGLAKRALVCAFCLFLPSSAPTHRIPLVACTESIPRRIFPTFHLSLVNHSQEPLKARVSHCPFVPSTRRGKLVDLTQRIHVRQSRALGGMILDCFGGPAPRVWIACGRRG
jgi:hypothetical protein